MIKGLDSELGSDGWPVRYRYIFFINENVEFMNFNFNINENSDAVAKNQKWEVFAEEPELPAQLPPLVELLTSKVEREFHPAIATMPFATLAAHMKHCHYRYLDNKSRECVFLSVLAAPSGSGKSFLDDIIEVIIEDIKAETDEANRQEEAWKRQVKACAKNAEKPVRPQFSRQILPTNTTNPTLVQRLMDADGKFLYTRTSELSTLTKMCGGMQGVSEVLRLAFDCAPYGQARVGEDGVNGEAPCRWQFNASTTIGQARSFFAKGNFADGTGSRIALATIDRDENSGIPVQGDYDQQFREEMKVYIDRLRAAEGEVGDARIREFMLGLVKEIDTEVMQANPEMKKYIQPVLNRAYIIAMSRAILLYVAHAGTWSEAMEEYVRWSLKYDLHCKMLFFGEQIIREMRAEYEAAAIVSQAKKKTGDVLSLLPVTFTKEDVISEYLKMGESPDKAKKKAGITSTWKKRKQIVEIKPGTWQKTEG